MAKSASVLKEIRTRLHLSQAECAASVGVPVETFRAWDSGRRTAPAAIVRRAQTLEAKQPPSDRVPLQVLADELHVHVRTLRAAAHDGRLAATFNPRPYFGKLTATATLVAPIPVRDQVVFVHGAHHRISRVSNSKEFRRIEEALGTRNEAELRWALAAWELRKKAVKMMGDKWHGKLYQIEKQIRRALHEIELARMSPPGDEH